MYIYLFIFILCTIYHLVLFSKSTTKQSQKTNIFLRNMKIRRKKKQCTFVFGLQQQHHQQQQQQQKKHIRS